MTWYSQILNNITFYKLLNQVDKEEFYKFHKCKCPMCGTGVLHAANYPRKPRGFDGELPKEYILRYGLCCSLCRKRILPVSVRFMGKKVYYTVSIILIMCLRYGPNKYRLKELGRLYGVNAKTILRWRKYWTGYFPETRLCRELRGYLKISLGRKDLPMVLVAAFEEANGQNEKAVLYLLKRLRSPPQNQLNLTG